MQGLSVWPLRRTHDRHVEDKQGTQLVCEASIRRGGKCCASDERMEEAEVRVGVDVKADEGFAEARQGKVGLVARRKV